MNPLIQGESSGGTLVRPDKRRRGRPRKDHYFDHFDKNLSQEADTIDGLGSVVGQPVAGFIESSFGDGYLLTVRIGNSATNMRGVVFKPGRAVPISAEIDVAPHLQMIRRDDMEFLSENRSSSHRPKLGVKRRDPSPKPSTSSVPPVDFQGNLVLQPADLQSQAPTAHQIIPGVDDVHVIEPLSIIHPNQATPAGQPFLQPITSTPSFGLGEKAEAGSTDSSEGDDVASSDASDEEFTSSGEEGSKPGTSNAAIEAFSAEPLQTAPTPNISVSLHNGSAASPLLSYGTGRMTELLQAVQENIKEKQIQASNPNVGTAADQPYK